jgi:WD40 repeat protein
MITNSVHSVVASIAHNTLTIYSIPSFDSASASGSASLSGKVIKHIHSRQLTCVAHHPTDAIIATGDESGVITLWYRYLQSDQLVTSSIHWHAHPVNSLVFTNDGSYILSGGQEGVLVTWQLATGHKQFLPRFGAHISSIRYIHH